MENDDVFGVDYGWFNRSSILSSKMLIDYNILPHQRTIQQKFQVETVKATTLLKEFKWIDSAQEENYLDGAFYKSISQLESTMNPGAFAFLIPCIENFQQLTLYPPQIQIILSRIKDPKSYVVRDSTQNVSHLLQEYILKFGITCEDLIRYILYLDQFRLNQI